MQGPGGATATRLPPEPGSASGRGPSGSGVWGRSRTPGRRLGEEQSASPGRRLRHQVPDGGIISTLDDQVRFLSALVGGQVFADLRTWARMHENTHRIFFPIEYGLGVMRYAPPRWMSPAFRVPPIFGHAGSTATWLFHCPDLGLVLAGAFDVAQPPLPFRFLPRVLRAVHLEAAANGRA